MSDPAPVSEVVVYAPPGLGLIPSAPEGDGPGSGPQNPTVGDPQYNPPTDPPDIDLFKKTLCFARAKLQITAASDGNANSEYGGLIYRGAGQYFSTDFFYLGPQGGNLTPAFDWLIANEVSFYNIAGEMHNHTHINPDSDLVNRMPSPLDFNSAAQMRDTYSLPDVLIGIIDPSGNIRVYTMDQAAHYATMSNDDKIALPNSALPPIVQC